MKRWRTGKPENIKFDSGKQMTPPKLVKKVNDALAGGPYERVSIGYPGEVLGGGNAKKLKELPEGSRRGANEMAYIGGVRMWEPVESLPTLAVYRQAERHAG